MNETSILQYCYFYKGEEICPKQYDGKNEGKLWQAEKFICEELFGLVDNSTPEQVWHNSFPIMCKNGRHISFVMSWKHILKSSRNHVHN